MTTIFCECCSLVAVHVSVSMPSHICKYCSPHVATLATLKLDHRRIADAFRAMHQKEVEVKVGDQQKSKATIEGLRSELDELINSVANDFADASENLLGVIRHATSVETEARIRDAYYARNRAMNALWVFDERHHAVLKEKCSCGLELRKCAEFLAFDFFRKEYQRWENKQIELMKAGKQHGLPANHNEARKVNVPSWRWSGMPAIGLEERRRRVS